MNALNEEKQMCKKITEEYQKEMERVLWEIETVLGRYGNDEWSAKEQKEKLQNTYYMLTQNQKKPYFARIDFEEENYDKKAYYIGKRGIQNEKQENILIDWRAPISSLYYDHSLGAASYQSPEGKVSGNLSLKRQYEFEEGKLSSYRDVDLVASDEILKPYLSVNAESRLQNIVASIQEEQNRIIRLPFFKHIIVQGVAGSGKTTVALHRIAYLVYNYKEQFQSKQYLLIGPNSFFVNYISSVLPELDVHDVLQKDFVMLVKQFCKEDYKVVSSSTSDSFYKVSMTCKEDIDSFLEKYMEERLTNASLEISPFPIFEKGFFLKIWSSLLHRKEENLYAMLEKGHQSVLKYVRQNEVLLLERMEKVFLRELDREENATLGKTYSYVTDRIRKGLQPESRKVWNKCKAKPSTLYKLFLKEKGCKKIDKGKYHMEDLGALLYIQYRLEGSGYYQNYKCTIVDEAQDYGPLHFYALMRLASNSHFNIFGDLAQSLYPERSIASWDEIEGFFQNVQILTLEKSYRTTIEIMTEANKINRFLRLSEAIPVIRHGKEVQYKKVEDYEKTVLRLLPLLSDKYKTIAIVHKDREKIFSLYEKIKSFFPVTYIDEESRAYKGGICLLTSALTKGLEFDVVLLLGGEDSVFSPESKLDMKLLYVSMTRALHELYVFYKEKVSSVLK